MLGELGYDTGRADGLLGVGTHKSISAFQRDHGIEIDGQYSETLLAQLRSRLANISDFYSVGSYESSCLQ